jgi:hypothetical protein
MGRHYKLAALQQTESCLHSRFGEAGPPCQLLKAEWNSLLFVAVELCPEPKIDHEGCGRVIVPDKVRHENVQNIFIDLNVLHG